MGGKTPKAFIFADTDNGGIIHVTNIKGGVGKSTVATNLAYALAQKGPTLLIDLDVQGSATVALGKRPAIERKGTSFTHSSSWELFGNRFAVTLSPAQNAAMDPLSRLKGAVKQFESLLFSPFVGRGDVTALVEKVDSCLDLIPAGSDLFKSVHWYHIQNFLYNLDICRNYYKYIVLDTPSVWNRLTRSLYRFCSLNLIPVTLSALSTKSLKDYLVEVRNLAARNPAIKIRIVKNEVFGREDSKIKGKTRTMNENRRFLDSLCEQVIQRSEHGIIALPQSILLDLEIPESAIVRDAQDEGKPVYQYHQYSAVARAFDELAKRIQYVLNVSNVKNVAPFWERFYDLGTYAFRAAVVTGMVLIFDMSPAVPYLTVPRPLAPQQLTQSGNGVVLYAFRGDESIYKAAKYAICYFRAMVPGAADVKRYALETVDIHNKTRLPGEYIIRDIDNIPAGINLSFYPPTQISNPLEKQLLPVYRYFTSMVRDPYGYVTGDWCVRGTGGGEPHYGLDIAARLGSEIVAPVDGVVQVRDSKTAGRILGIVKEGTVIFFCHMDRRYFRSGDAVKRGMPVGTVGMTGQTSGPHAHVAYGVRDLSHEGIQFGNSFYKLTDPKLFFYREVFINRLAGSP